MIPENSNSMPTSGYLIELYDSELFSSELSSGSLEPNTREVKFETFSSEVPLIVRWKLRKKLFFEGS